jgi:hypothetical protein
MIRWIRRLNQVRILVPVALIGAAISQAFQGGLFGYVMSTGMGLAAILALSELFEQAVGPRAGRWFARFPAIFVHSLTALATLLAGRRRPALPDEWKAHLAGESGRDPVTWPKVRQALGFVASGVRFRLAEAADLAWRPVDAVLASLILSNLFVWGPVTVMLVAIVHHDGRFGLVADDQDPVALGAFLYVVIKTGRWWRGVKPPEPKARRARSDGENR